MGSGTGGRSRFSDIIAFDPKSPKVHTIDPTIRYDQMTVVHVFSV